MDFGREGPIASVSRSPGDVWSTPQCGHVRDRQSSSATGQLRTSRACAHRYRIALTRTAAWRYLVRDHGLDIGVGEAGPGAKRIPTQRRRADGSQTPSAQSPASFGKASHDHRAFQTRHAAHLRERCRRFCPEMNDVSREGAVKAVISEGQRISRSQMKARLARGRQAGIEAGCFGDRFSQRPRRVMSVLPQHGQTFARSPGVSAARISYLFSLSHHPLLHRS